MPTTLKPGAVVKDKTGSENYGLLMEVIDEAETQVLVSYINLDGLYKEIWISKEKLEPLT